MFKLSILFMSIMLCLMTELKYDYILASVPIGFLNRSKISLSHVEGGINFLIKLSAVELINASSQMWNYSFGYQSGW